MKKFLILAVVVLSLAFAMPVLAQSQGEVIKSFDSKIVVNQDSTMNVTEIISVYSTGDQIKHGIYRDFPTIYSKDGVNYTVGFDVLSVKKNGLNEPYISTNLSNGERLYIGDSSKIIPPGDYIYEINYTTDHQLGYFDDHDELYWNVTGNDWVFPIENASAQVILPQEISSTQITMDAFSGFQGSKDKNYISEKKDNSVIFKTTQPLQPNQGLTIVVGWPKGFVDVVSPVTSSANSVKNLFIFGSLLFLPAFAGFFVVLLYFLVVWYLRGRGPKKGTIIAIYDPPLNLSPAEMAYIFRMGFTTSEFTAAILNMAVKGYLKIEEKDKEYTLVNASDDKSKLTPEETAIANVIFDGRDKLVLQNSHHEILQAAQVDFIKYLKQSYSQKYFISNNGLFLIGVVLSVIACFLSFFMFVIAVFIYIVICFIFYNLLKAPTNLGRATMDQVEGFKWFLSVTEKDRMNFHNPPEKTPELFEKFLPYALALGVQNKWAEQFNDVFKRLDEEGHGYTPSWYMGSNLALFSASHFRIDIGLLTTPSSTSWHSCLNCICP